MMQMKIGLNVGTFARLPCANQYFAISTKADLIESAWNTCKATFFLFSLHCTVHTFLHKLHMAHLMIDLNAVVCNSNAIVFFVVVQTTFPLKMHKFWHQKIGKRGRWWKMTWSHTHTHGTTQFNTFEQRFHWISCYWFW